MPDAALAFRRVRADDVPDIARIHEGMKLRLG